MKIINNIVIGGTLLCLPVLGFAASPPLVSFEEGTTNPAMPALNVGNPVEGWGVVHENMNIHSPTMGPEFGGPGTAERIPATLIESYNPLVFPPLTNVAYSGPNPYPLGAGPNHLPNACLEDVEGIRVYPEDSARRGTGDRYARGFAVVQPYSALGPAENFVGWEIDIEYDDLVSNFFITMFDFGDFNPLEQNTFHANMTAFNAANVPVISQTLEFTTSDTLVIRLLLASTGDACGAKDYRGTDPDDPNPANRPDPGYIAGTLEYAGIKRVEVRGLGHDPKIGFDSIDFDEYCNYTRGYWSNHEWVVDPVELGGIPYTWANDNDAIFARASNKNFGQLCAQLTAAIQNCQGVACDASVDIDAANVLLAGKSCVVPEDFVDKAEKVAATLLKDALDAFNMGYNAEGELIYSCEEEE